MILTPRSLAGVFCVAGRTKAKAKAKAKAKVNAKANANANAGVKPGVWNQNQCGGVEI